jgi:hypothetical protein
MPNEADNGMMAQAPQDNIGSLGCKNGEALVVCMAG